MASIEHLPVDAKAEDLVSALAEHGAIIVDGFLSDEVLTRFNREIDPHLARKSPTAGHVNEMLAYFHGDKTRHLTGVAGISDTFINDILLHPIYQILGDAFLLPSCAAYLLNIAHVIDRGAGSTEQFVHRDHDTWPRRLNSVVEHRQFASLIALSEYSAEMGATRVVPGSHKWDPDREPTPDEIVAADMPPGSAVIYLGATLHAAGANTTNKQRRGMHTSFCLGWLRTEENNFLAVSTTRAKTLPRRAQELLGFGVHDGIAFNEGFLGAFDNRNPIELLESGEL